MKKEELDKIVLSYLRKKGYQAAEKAFCQESGIATTGKLHQLDAENRVLNMVLLFNVADGEPTLYNEAFDKLFSWVMGSLDLYKYELCGVLYPVFLHVFLQLHEKGAPSAAQQLFNKFRRAIIVTSPPRMQRQRAEELQDLQGITSAQHIVSSRTAKAAKTFRYPVTMCSFSFELLNHFLSSSEILLLILYVVNERLQITVNSGPPVSPADTGTAGQDEDGEGQEGGFGLLSMGDVGAVGGHVVAANLQPMKLGLLKGDTEYKLYEEMRAREEQEAGKEEQDKQKRKPIKKGDGSATATASQPKQRVGIIHVDTVDADLPLSYLNEDEEAAVTCDVKRRAIVTADALPSCMLYTFVNTHQSLNCTTVSKDGTLVVGGFSDSSIRVYDVEAMAAQRMTTTSQSAEPASGGEPASSVQSQKDTDTGDMEEMDWEGDATGTPDSQGRDKPSQNPDRTIDSLRRRQPQDRDELICLSGHAGPVYSVSWSANQRYLLSSSADCTVRLWSLELGSNLVAFRGHSHPVWAVQASPQGHYFATGSADRTARVWSTEHRQALRLLVGHQSDVDAVSWHPSCNYVATGSSDTTVRLWHAASGSCVRILVGHRTPVCSLAMSPCGRQLASGSSDGTICLWDLNEGKRLSQLKGHAGPVWALGFSHGMQGGPVLSSGGADCTVRIWGSASLLQEAGHQKNPAGNGAEKAYGLLRTYRTKSTPAYDVSFTHSNLLSVTGALTLRSSTLAKH